MRNGGAKKCFRHRNSKGTQISEFTGFGKLESSVARTTNEGVRAKT